MSSYAGGHSFVRCLSSTIRTNESLRINDFEEETQERRCKFYILPFIDDDRWDRGAGEDEAGGIGT
jgi:hypothetical protein